jgi:hypothetical protein
MNTKDLRDIAQLGSTMRVLVNILREEPRTVVREEIQGTMKKLLRMMFSVLTGK